ncbi:fumarylacetoacetate hydrolase family protein [Pontibacillus sp. HMF3514]|uniref:fumarylacetoacetate hydrolase family protein n=1 Tax=Pontibacillus sp. HMF3514 TaxID=2692425 RepID=UPI00131FC064|nr:fumarylacetoacetate hydrolase family protein [Pontibacillus sp. HMF3514]QHE52394.1 4-hydroxyphenylacetate isomerase [Pontibacillus sp. HMF3514]
MSQVKLHLSGQKKPTEATLQSDNKIEVNGATYSQNDLHLDAPIDGTIYGVLLNYKGAIEELGNQMYEPPHKQPPQAPILYIKPANTINASKRAVPMPIGENQLEVGASLGIVIGKTACNVTEANAMDYVQGYTIANDISIPHESVYRPAVKHKARDGFCPVGPWVVEKESIKNPDECKLQVYVNGELRQENSTTNLVRSIPKLIQDITEFMTLNEGDLLLTGVPENAPIVEIGDHVKISVEGIGVLENTIKSERDWMLGGVSNETSSSRI